MTSSLTMRDLVSPRSILCPLEAANKKAVLQGISNFAASLVGKEPLAIFDILWERERLGTTGVGAGIAIPHGRIDGLTQVHGFFFRLSQPLAFEAIDDKPVDLVFLLLAPESAGADHLNALATVSRQLRDQKLCEQLRMAKDAAALYRLLTEAPPAKAA